MTDKKTSKDLEEPLVLGKAVTSAAERLGISGVALGAILGLSPSTITRLRKGGYKLHEHRKEWEFAMLFVRLFHSLNTVTSDEETARRWFGSENLRLHGRPVDLVRRPEGLVRVIQYLEASRGLS